MIIIREKYNLAPRTTIDSSDSTQNYQSLDFGPPNYQLLVFWPLPSVCTIKVDGKCVMCEACDSFSLKARKCPSPYTLKF
jgi:hypothetical protein